MVAKSRFLVKNACYHIITRGNQKQRVFLDDQDYHVYLLRLKKYKQRYKFCLYGFCLMPNHVHLLGEFQMPENLIKFMQCLNRSYVTYFNKKHSKVGHLWQGRFKSKIITKDKYLLDCAYYIETNPLRANLVERIGEYKWSSYQERIFSQNVNIKLLDELTI